MSAALAVANTNNGKKTNGGTVRLSRERWFDLRNEMRAVHQSLAGTGIWSAALALHDIAPLRLPKHTEMGRIDARIERQRRDIRLTFWFYADGSRAVHLAECARDAQGAESLVVVAIFEDEALVEILACAKECANA